MGNGIQNAGFLDGTAGWTGLSGAALSVDAAVVGGPGRAVLTASRVVAAGAAVEVASSTVAVTAGQMLEAFAGVASAGDASLAVEILGGGGARLALVEVPVRRPGSGAPRRGLQASFASAYAAPLAPATGAARLVASSVAGFAGAHAVHLLKPYLALAGTRRRARWDPGAHANPDLQRPVWPSVLPAFLAESTVEPFANRRAFAVDGGVPAGFKLYDGLHHALRGRLRLTPEEADALDAFYDETDGEPFFVVRPDTDQLCLAEWLADGAPRPVEAKGANVVREVGLHIWVA